MRHWARDFPLVNLIGATADDVRDVMVEGESGVLAVCPRDERPRYVAHRRRLEWPNGAKSLLFSAEEPERLRGKQHMKLWADELAAWRYPEAWDQAVFGLRLGDKPQAIVTTTPRPTKLMRDLLADPLTFSTQHSTFENIGNLAENFLDRVVRKYEGTRLGRQELHAHMLLDVPGALWTREMVEAAHVGKDEAPKLGSHRRRHRSAGDLGRKRRRMRHDRRRAFARPQGFRPRRPVAPGRDAAGLGRAGGGGLARLFGAIASSPK